MGLDTKYRPKVFEDVVGQDVIVAILRSIVKKGSYNSAYIFSGPSGTGKTTVARIFAKAILCEKPVDGNPCGVCESCLLFDDEKNFGYVEMDAASVGGKEDMVKLRDDAAFISMGRKKILYLDECQDISRQGQDALLKQIEQCPPHLIYLFSTTEIEKIKPALRKRCIQFQFSKVSSEQIFNRLKYISITEGIPCEDKALGMIAGQADGHVRDAVKLLEKVSCLESVTVDNVMKVSVDYSSEISDILINLGSDLSKSIEIYKKISLYISPSEFYNQMISLVCDAIKLNYGYSDFSPERKSLLEKLNSVHGSDLAGFLDYMISRERFIDRTGLQCDIILLHHKFSSCCFKSKDQEQVIQGVQQSRYLDQSSSTPSFPVLTHAQLMTFPLKERIKILQRQRSISHNSQEKEETPKIAGTWSLPKEERQGSDSSDLTCVELPPLVFSQLMVGGRGGGST